MDESRHGTFPTHGADLNRSRNHGSATGDSYNVTSHNQQGGITAGQININAAPTVRGRELFKDQKQPDGRYLTRVILQVDSPPAGRIMVVARSPAVVHVAVQPASGQWGMLSATEGELEDKTGFAARMDHPPTGTDPIQFDIYTDTPGATLELAVEFV